jgi:serine/threonine-protein kinase
MKSGKLYIKYLRGIFIMANKFNPPLTLNEVNQCFDNITVTDVINPGGQGAVFKAKDNQRKLFLKIYYSYLTIRAEREVEKLKKLSNEYFIKLFDYGYVELREDKCFYSLTEFIDGKSLRKIINKRTLNDVGMKDLIVVMGKAIDELWSFDIVHRDIKPENIMKTEDDDYKLIDLGIAKHRDLKTITQSGAIVGTLPYMSPEQIKGRKNLTLRSDLFALGIVLYEAYTGKHPFIHNPFAIGKIDPVPIESINPEVDKTIVEVINKLLKPKAIERPVSGEEIINYLFGGKE